MDGGFGYLYFVDWWFLGVIVYELLWGWRLYEIYLVMLIDEIFNMFKVECVYYFFIWCKGMVVLLRKFLIKDFESCLFSFCDI